jgi:hydroxymethylbilane synthase
MRPDLRIADIRGNVDTRISKVERGDYDAVVLAAAGLARLGWLDRASQIFEPGEMLPAVGQGALAVQVRSDDAGARVIVETVDDIDTRIAITAERAFERRLGGGCHAAIAALGVSSAVGLHLRGLVGDATGHLIHGEVDGPVADAEALGVKLAGRLIEQGAAELLEATA